MAMMDPEKTAALAASYRFADAGTLDGLVERYRDDVRRTQMEWANTPHPGFGGQTPAEWVRSGRTPPILLTESLLAEGDRVWSEFREIPNPDYEP